ncbi:hypothetical protein RRF57_010878 [Xylaria bambusicola]|uniref:Uncharacterized protein n=1 Tax=Xylaria bambusicola TaxID=326684 RepID=A0AAN7ZCT3_9PEZI
MRGKPRKRIGQGQGGDAMRCTHRQLCGSVDKLPYLNQVIKDGWIDRAWERHVVVRVGKSFEHFDGQLEPWSMKRRYVSPMPAQRRR